MAFNQTEQNIIKYGLQNGKSREQVEQALINYRTGTTPTKAPVEKPSYIERVGGELKKSYADLTKTTERGAELMTEGKPIQGAVMSGLGAPAAFIRGAFAPITAAIAPAIEKGLKDSGVLDNATVQEKIKGFDDWAKANPDLAKNSQSVFDIVTTLIGAKGVTSAIPKVKSVTEGVTKSLAEGVESVIETGTKAIEAVKPVVKGAGDVISGVAESAVRLPKKIATNVAQKQAESAAIKELPTAVAQEAAKNGIETATVKSLYSIPAEVKPAAKELIDRVVQFTKSGGEGADPIEMVGKPIVARLKELSTLQGTVGQKLGVVADTLGKVTTKEVKPLIFNNIKKVLGGITEKNGVLNFTNTTLKTNTAAQKEIQRMFTEAIANGTGKQKHLLRQELFEILGGKKSSLANLTDTHEKALEAIRKGLSDVLDTKNTSYKALNQEYAKLVQPLNDMRKLMKAAGVVDEDILDMSAGILARRLTSTSLSQGQITKILRAMDAATAVKGTTEATTEALQKLYNVLGQYYDIAPKTGFKGSIEGAFNLKDVIYKQIKNLAGESDAVRQEALEKVFTEVFAI